MSSNGNTTTTNQGASEFHPIQAVLDHMFYACDPRDGREVDLRDPVESRRPSLFFVADLLVKRINDPQLKWERERDVHVDAPELLFDYWAGWPGGRNACIGAIGRGSVAATAAATCRPTQFWEIQMIVDGPEIKTLNGFDAVCYAVQWTGYAGGTWEPQDLLPLEAIADYEAAAGWEYDVESEFEAAVEAEAEAWAEARDPAPAPARARV